MEVLPLGEGVISVADRDQPKRELEDRDHPYRERKPLSPAAAVAEKQKMRSLPSLHVLC